MADLTEALIANTIDCFQSFPLQDLDEEWFNDLWINHFSSLEDYPSSGTAIFREELFEPITNAIEVCEKWIEQSLESNSANPENETLTSSEEVLWTVLMDNCIDIKYVLGFIFAVCSKGIKPSALRFEEEMALKCAKLYFTLLQIPGNSAYSVYYPSLLQLSFDCLKFPKESVPGKKRPPTSAYRSEVMSRRKRIQRKDSPEELMDTDEVEVREQKCDDLLLKCFIDVLKSVIPLLQTFSLSGNYEVIAHITQKLSECVAIESRPIRLNLSRSVDEILRHEFQRQNGLANVVVALGYYIYLNLCQPLHGDVNEIYRLCLQSLCGHILCSKAKGQAITQKHTVVRDNSLAFVCYNLKNNFTYSVEVTKILIQRLCIRCVDKTDYRVQVASAVVKILACYPLKEYVEMIEWFVVFGTQKQQDKMVVLEIFSTLLMAPEREITPEITWEWRVYTTHIPLVFFIIERCDDKVPTVRAKALSVLANTLKRIMEVIIVGQRDFGLAGEDEEIEAGSAKENEDNGKEDDAERLEANSDGEANKDNGDKNDDGEANETEVKNDEAVTPPESERVNNEQQGHQPYTSEFKLCSVEEFIELLLFRAVDLKVHVRKFALQAIEYLLCLDEAYLREKFLSFLSRATRDPNVTVRKSSVCSLTIILHKYHDNSLVQKVWMKSVLPVVFDEEKSVQSKGLEEMEQLFLLNYGNSSSMKHCSWTMLTEIACGDHNDLLRYLQKAYCIWKSEDKLKPNLSHLIEAQLGMEYDAAAWMLLSILSSNIVIKNITGIVNRWKQSFETSVPISTQMRMLQVLGNTCTHMKADQLQDLQTLLESQLSSFDCHFQLVKITVETLYKVYKAKYKRKNEPEKLMIAFASELMEPAEKFLTELVMDTNLTGEHTDDRISQYLQMVGDLAVVAPPSVAKTNLLLILQSIIATTSTSKGINYGTSTDITVKVWRLCPKIQAIALTSLGKLCLTNQKYPEKCLPIFIKELATSKSFMVRMNIVTVLADLCVRYTSTVDLYIPSMSGCLKDSNVNVRCQTLALISRLLQEDYIKLKDSLLYRLLSCLVDGDDDMRNMVEYCLGGLLAKKQPSIFFQHFVEAIFYFNASAPLPRLKVNQSKQDTRVFALKGRKNFEKRMTIYKFMVCHTPVIKRVLIVLKLVEDILNTSATLAMPINDSTEAVIKDTLAVLSLDEFKPTQGYSNATDDNDETESTDSITCKSLFRNTIISAVVPITITLKKTLAELKSPLIVDILQFIAETCKDYKNEVKSMFATDKALVEEIEFVIKKYEKELEKKKRRNSSGVEEIEVDPESPKPSSAVAPSKTDATRSEDERAHQLLVNDGIDTINKLVVLQRVSVPNREPVNVAELFSGDGVWNPNRTDNNENSRHHQVRSSRIPLSETPTVPHDSGERNTAAGNITVCDIGNAEWDDGRHSVNTSRANTRRSRRTEPSE